MSPSEQDLQTQKLYTNLDAIQRTNPVLGERICWPVGDEHTRFDDSGTLLYQFHRTWFELEPDATTVAHLGQNCRGDETIFLAGIGLGTQLRDLLERFPHSSIIAWDRDPWMLRLALRQYDYSQAVLTGKLQFRLGADVLNEPDILNRAELVTHHNLGVIYHREIELLKTAPHPKIALLRQGALYIDDMANAFRRQGYGVYTLDTDHLSAEEMEFTVKQLGARVLGSVNYTRGLAEFCEGANLKLVCYEIDPSLVHPTPASSSTSHVHIFSYRKSNVAEFKNAGFANVSYLPLASDIERRCPQTLEAEDKAMYAPSVSFVGASLVTDGQTFRDEFIQHYVEWRNQPSAIDEATEKLQSAWDEQSRDYSRYVLADALNEQFGDFLAAMKQTHPHLDLEMMAAQTPAAEKRLSYVATLAPYGIRVWGDTGWALLREYGVDYTGQYANHHEDLPKVYSGSTINVDIGRLYQSDIVTMRVFDTLACGGFLITEHNDALLELFEPDVELVTYRTAQELTAKVDYYLKHPEEARAIAERGRQAVIERHTMRQRFDSIFGAAAIS
ncbi:MAG: glycosyltransferase [Myxococcota bacterium]|nr:glycosyltransferase [Myxococcota bacterium]